MRLFRAWYTPVQPGAYRLTAAGCGTSGFRTVRTASQARASYCTARPVLPRPPSHEGAL